MTVSVVIPTTLQRQSLVEAVGSAVRSAAGLPGAEVLVVANGPAKPVYLHRIDSPLVRVLRCQRASAPAARNAGVAAAANDIVLFTDDDCVVPPTWCRDLAGPLAHAAVAVAAPVEFTVSGPITAFLNYQRIFHAPPMDRTRTRYLITASAGIRKDVVGGQVTFDEQTFNVGGEDTAYGYALRDLGLDISWLGEAEPVNHLLSESVEEITDRFSSYGRASARLYYRLGRWQESVPDAVDWFGTIADGGYDEHRRFGEMLRPAVRRAFASYELMLTSAFLVGYLEEIGREIGHPLVAPAWAALRSGWRQIHDALDLDGEPTVTWRALPADLAGWSNRLAGGQHGRPAQAISVNLKRSAPILKRSLAPDVDRVVNGARCQFLAWQRVQRLRVRAIAEECWRGAIADPSALERRLREAGLSFIDGCHELEKTL